MKSYSEESISDAAIAEFKTCDGCHRWLRLGMFFDNAKAWHDQRPGMMKMNKMNDVCRCCKYQAWLAETAGPKNPMARLDTPHAGSG
ncbi:hypothetical protein F5Y01DRAFT_320191 [Xylaria sp. FL0043]|nr:hypothetical protein F5Y01DRAFT_320191 [Xylaria sp. FL0043]